MLSLSYGIVAMIGYTANFGKNMFLLHRGQSNLFFHLAQQKDGVLTIAVPPDLALNVPALVFIYDQQGTILWRQRYVPELELAIDKNWLKKSGFYELNSKMALSNALLGENTVVQNKLKKYNALYKKKVLTHSVSVNNYPANDKLPALTIVVVDSVPQQLARTERVWEWFNYVLLANLLLVTPLLWLATRWSLRPIKALANQIGQLEKGKREQLDENLPQELYSLVHKLNILLNTERQRYTKYRTTLADLTHSLKTPLAVLQTTLRSLRMDKQTTIKNAEPIMLEQISRISQQIGYYLHRASIHSEHNVLKCEIHSVPILLDSLCRALNKVYQRKDLVLRLDISPEVTFIGEQNDFMEVMGNILENACKYCLEFVEITVLHADKALTIVVDDDGPGIEKSKRALIFQRGQRLDTLRPGQGLGLSVAAEIIEHYQGNITISESKLGGAKVLVTFAQP